MKFFLPALILNWVLAGQILLAGNAGAVLQTISSEKQLLLNGRIWRNQFTKAFGDQFFLTDSYLKGSVVFNGRKFNNLDLRYDIAGDELLLRYGSYPVIMMNKEMVDSFTLEFGNRVYHIINFGNDSTSVLRGYVNLLYGGPASLYVKYVKKIQPLAVDGRYDLLYQEHDVFLKKGSGLHRIKHPGKLISLLDDRKREIKSFLRMNRIRLNGKDPATYIRVLQYYDSLNN